MELLVTQRREAAREPGQEGNQVSVPHQHDGGDRDPLGFQPLASLQASSLTNPSPQEPESRPRGEPGPGPSVHPGPAPGSPSPVRPHGRVPVAPRADISHTRPRRMVQVHRTLQPDKSPPSPASVSSSEKPDPKRPSREPQGKERKRASPFPFPTQKPVGPDTQGRPEPSSPGLGPGARIGTPTGRAEHSRAPHVRWAAVTGPRQAHSAQTPSTGPALPTCPPHPPAPARSPRAPHPTDETQAPPRPYRPQRPPSPALTCRPPEVARPPGQATSRKARRCSLMARAGERSHPGGGPISPRPAGSGSHGLWRCHTVDEQSSRSRRGRRPGRASVSARQLGVHRNR